VVHRALHILSLICCLIITASFVLFAHDQVAGASRHQTDALILSGSPVSGGGATRAAKQPRAFIDGASKTLTGPFTSIIHSSNPWVDRGVPAALALVVYGFGLGFIARYARPGAYVPKGV
jgi:TRAP-type C4-dicarboxylate transport system permease small subunit